MLFLKFLRRNLIVRYYSICTKFSESAIDWDYFSNPSNYNEITSNITSRNAHCDIKGFLEELHLLHKCKDDPNQCKVLKASLTKKLYWLPNFTHPDVLQNKSKSPVVLQKFGNKTPFAYFPTNFDSLTKKLNLLRRKNLGQMCGSKSYFLKNDLALLEQSLIRYAVEKLKKKGFQLVSVPDVLPKESFEDCGMRTENKHSQVYHIYDDWASNLCLSGTSEMALATYLSGKIFKNEDLPLKLCAVSRCYRAEANKHQKEKGIFRVHCFTKVEMFGVTSNEFGLESEEMLKDFTDIQKELYSEIGLHFQVLEMPPSELGLPAYHKIDMEAWIPTQKMYGEISSASNCTDYQSKRLNILYSSKDKTKFCHTVNGTACAIPRLLISIVENFQRLNGTIDVPFPLRKYMKCDVIKDRFKEIMLCTRPIP